MSRLLVEALRLDGIGPIDLVVGPGECIAIGGPSGSGKTRLLRAVADLDPHGGRVLLDGVDCGSVDAPTWRRRVGLLRPESRWWRETVGQHLAAVEEDRLKRLGFEADVLRRPVAQLSSGERQRLALVRLLANRPKVLLLDEPTAHLDAEATAAVESLVRDYRKQTEAAVLWVTHDPTQAKRVATRGFRLDGGSLSALEAS